MSFCINCGVERVVEGKFCFACGASQEPARGLGVSEPDPGEGNITAEILETYEQVCASNDFDPESISAETFLGLVYATITEQKAAKLTKAGLEILIRANESLTEILEAIQDSER